MIEFDLEGHEFITLNNLLKVLNFVESGGDANNHIVSGEVIVNDKVETQKRKKLRTGDKIIFNENTVIIQ